MEGASGGGDDGASSTSHIREILRLIDSRELSVGSADDGVGLDADLAQRGDRVLGGLGLQLPGRADVGHQGDVEEEQLSRPMS